MPLCLVTLLRKSVRNRGRKERGRKRSKSRLQFKRTCVKDAANCLFRMCFIRAIVCMPPIMRCRYVRRVESLRSIASSCLGGGVRQPPQIVVVRHERSHALRSSSRDSTPVTSVAATAASWLCICEYCYRPNKTEYLSYLLQAWLLDGDWHWC